MHSPLASLPQMARKVSQRGYVSSFKAMEVMVEANKLAASGRKVIRMEVGQPSAPTPSKVRQAGVKSAELGRIGYTEPLGHPALRDRIALDYDERYGVSIPHERIAIVTGSSAAFILAFLSAFEAGDRIGLPAPGYPAYRNIMTSLGLVPVDIQTTAADGWVPSVEALQAKHTEAGLSGFLVASPANPTGAVIAKKQFVALQNTCDALGIRFMSDEIYHRLEYVEPSPTAASPDVSAVVINSFSKYFCMTGWRIGWMVMPEELVEPCTRLAQNLFICPPDIAQQAVMPAFDCIDELEGVKAGYATNRNLLLKGLPELGFMGPDRIDGAFYAYPGIEAFSDNSEHFAAQLLQDAGIAVTPGTDFDPIDGKRYIRMSFCLDDADIQEALDRLATFLNR